MDLAVEMYRYIGGYVYIANNPIMFTDPTGMEQDGVDHDYKINRNGKMELLKETKDNFDRIY